MIAFLCHQGKTRYYCRLSTPLVSLNRTFTKDPRTIPIGDGSATRPHVALIQGYKCNLQHLPYSREIVIESACPHDQLRGEQP